MSATVLFAWEATSVLVPFQDLVIPKGKIHGQKWRLRKVNMFSQSHKTSK